MTALLRLSVAAVRLWTRVYTWRMPRSVREARRAEIESDLWECQTDEAAGPALPMQIMGRLALGVFDDMRWRAEHARTTHNRVQCWHCRRAGVRVGWSRNEFRPTAAAASGSRRSVATHTIPTAAATAASSLQSTGHRA